MHTSTQEPKMKIHPSTHIYTFSLSLTYINVCVSEWTEIHVKKLTRTTKILNINSFFSLLCQQRQKAQRDRPSESGVENYPGMSRLLLHECACHCVWCPPIYWPLPWIIFFPLQPNPSICKIILICRRIPSGTMSPVFNDIKRLPSNEAMKSSPLNLSPSKKKFFAS